jgi:putative OPT family oligopeptide transporter
MALGGVLCLSNLYVVLKTGWSLGITLTATIVAWALFRALQVLGLSRREFTALENNAVATVASAGAWMTGGGNMAALPALLLLTGARPGGWAMFTWFAVIAALGVVVAIPLKRQLIDREQLPFPMSVATAHTIRSLHEPGHEGGTAARQLVWAGLVATVLTLARDLKAAGQVLPARLAMPFSLAGRAAGTWSLGFDVSLVLLGGGSLMAPRTAWSLFLGAALTWGVLAPHWAQAAALSTVDFKALVQLTLWPGAALLATSGVLAFGRSWRAVPRAVGDLLAALRRRGGSSASALDDEEAPLAWFVLGFLGLAPVMVALLVWLFQVPLWAAVLSLPLSLVVGVVAARVTGETDVTPTKAMGPLTQLVFGLAVPGNLTANVMSANVTAGVGLHAADLLGDLKTGAMLGAHPRQQVIAQVLGLVVGAAVAVPAFSLLVPDAAVLGSEQFPAPAVMVWAGVSRALAVGLSGVAPVAREAMGWAALLGVVLVVLETWAPPRWRALVPSPSALGIAMVIPAATAFTMCLGALVGAWGRRRWPAFAQRSAAPLASGLIAGESVTGIVVALARALGAPL